MELEWGSRPSQYRGDPRAPWTEHQQPSSPPVSFDSSPQHNTSLLSQRRRSSAASARPAGPPPNLPIPNLPPNTQNGMTYSNMFPSSDSNNMYSSGSNSISRGTRLPSNTFSRPLASPNLSAVAAFSQVRQAAASTPNSTDLSAVPSSIDDLSDSPPQSYLNSASMTKNRNVPELQSRGLLAPPSEHTPRPDRPSSRRALTKALALAREAVQLDSTNDNPEAAVQAYAQSVALLSEVMDRVRNGEDSTADSSHRRRRRRSVAAQEEEVRRLQNIHDTYADRMNILSIIYSIPAVPYTTTSTFPNTTVSSVSTSSNSPTASTSPSAENSPHIPQQVYTPYIPEEPAMMYSSNDYVDRDPDAVYTLNEAVLTRSGPMSDLPPTQHPYSLAYDNAPPSQPVTPPRNSTRRSRVPANLPPKPPPPSASLPPAPIDIDHSHETYLSQNTHTAEPSNKLADGPSHKRTPSNLGPLEEVREDVPLLYTPQQNEAFDESKLVPDTPRTSKRESPPLPPLPSPSLTLTSDTSQVPRSISLSAKPPSSPRMQNINTIRQRAHSQLALRTEPTVPQLNPTNLSTILQRRDASAPSSIRSPSPSESVISNGSTPHSKPPVPTMMNAPPHSRGRSSSQPGRPSAATGRISPDQRPPLPSINGTPRKVSMPSRLNPNSANVPLESLGPYSAAVYSSNLPTTPTSPLPPLAPSDPLLKPYHLMGLLKVTMTSPTGGYVTRRLHVPCEVWSQGGAKLTNLDEKIRVVTILCSALEDLEKSSAEHFGAGNVSSGLALGIGSIGRKEADAWLTKLEDFSNVCDHVVANFGKRLGVGEGFVARKPTWGGKLFSRFDKFTNGKNSLDSPAAYVSGLKKLFDHVQLLDEHSRAILSQPIAPSYGAFPMDIRNSAEQKLKRFSEFFASVVLTFVVRDLSQLLDKYVKKCEKWLVE